MSSAALSRAQDPDSKTNTPTGRILSAGDYAKMLTSDHSRRTSDDGHISRLPSLHEQAWQHGYERGMHKVFSELKSTLVELRDCRHDRDDWLRRFVFAVLRKVIKENDVESLVPSIVEQAIEECERSIEMLTVHVHPDVAGVVVKRLSKSTSKDLKIDVVSDERLSEAACEIHTPFGIIDAGLDTQLDALEHAVCSDSSQVSHG